MPRSEKPKAGSRKPEAEMGHSRITRLDKQLLLSVSPHLLPAGTCECVPVIMYLSLACETYDPCMTAHTSPSPWPDHVGCVSFCFSASAPDIFDFSFILFELGVLSCSCDLFTLDVFVFNLNSITF